MKKSFSLLLALVLILSVFCGCADKKDASEQTTTETTTAQTTEVPADVTTEAPEYTNPPEPIDVEMPAQTLSAEDVVKIYMDNIDVWQYTPEADEWYGYLFLDLDFDGVLELVQSVNTGSGDYSTNTYFTVDTDTASVREIPFPAADSEYLHCDFTGQDYPDLYVNNATGKLHYMTSDYISNGTYNDTTIIGELRLSDEGNIEAKNLWAVHIDVKDGNYENVEISYSVYNEDGAAMSVDEETYLNTLSEYERENSNQLLEFKTVLGHGDHNCYYSEFAEIDYAEQYDVLLEAYNAFKY